MSNNQKKLGGFTLVDTLKSDELNLEIIRLMHEKSGAMIYNIKSNNNDNTFAPIVRTLPENDKGCPHIL
jgi:Zn-dependent M16 (insulinase) family peptidase